MSAQNTNEEVPIAGINSILPKEHGNKFYTLQILQHLEKDVCAIASWDSSLHDSQALNRVTEGTVSLCYAQGFLFLQYMHCFFLWKYNVQCVQHCISCILLICFIYFICKLHAANNFVVGILKTTVRLSHPAPMDLVLRKRISLNIYKRQSIAERLKKSKWLGRAEYSLTQTGVTYEVVSNIPKASEELEDRESLAQLAASGEDNSACDGETYIGSLTIF